MTQRHAAGACAHTAHTVTQHTHTARAQHVHSTHTAHAGTAISAVHVACRCQTSDVRPSQSASSQRIDWIQYQKLLSIALHVPDTPATGMLLDAYSLILSAHSLLHSSLRDLRSTPKDSTASSFGSLVECPVHAVPTPLHSVLRGLGVALMCLVINPVSDIQT